MRAPGARPEIATSFAGLEAQAKQKMTTEAWAYVAGGAGLESAMEANRAAFSIDSAPNQGTLVKITFPTTRVLAG